MVLKNPFVDQANNAIDYWWELQALEPQVYYNTFFYSFYYYVNATTKATEISKSHCVRCIINKLEQKKEETKTRTT